MIKVLVIEGYEVVAQGLKALLEDEPGIEVVGIARTTEEAAELAENVRPNVALLDYRLPGGTGADAAGVLRMLQPDIVLLFLSRDESKMARFSALEAGAAGYLLMSQASDDLIGAVRRAAAGQVVFSPQSVAELLSWRRESAHFLDHLTAREREVLDLLCQGLDNHAIARRLGVRYGTVRSHVRSLISKLGVHSRLQVLVKAADLGLVEH